MLRVSRPATGRRRARRLVAAAGAVSVLLTLGACEGLGGDSPDGADRTGSGGDARPDVPDDALVATLAAPEETSVVEGDPAERALGTSAALFASAPVVVITAPQEQGRAASAAVAGANCAAHGSIVVIPTSRLL